MMAIAASLIQSRSARANLLNDSIVTAKVKSINQVSGDYPWELTIEIEQSQGVPGKVNGTADKIGQQIKVLTKDISSVKVDQIITAHVTFQGDERGGVYYATIN